MSWASVMFSASLITAPRINSVSSDAAAMLMAHPSSLKRACLERSTQSSEVSYDVTFPPSESICVQAERINCGKGTIIRSSSRGNVNMDQSRVVYLSTDYTEK